MKVDLSELRALLDKATPGPWESRIEPQHYPECDDTDLPASISGNGQHIAWLSERYDRDLGQVNDVDAALIVTLRNAAPALLDAYAERDRLKKESDQLRAALEPFAAIADVLDEVDFESDDRRINVVQSYGCLLGELSEEDFANAVRALSHDTTQRSEKGEADDHQ